MQTSLELQTQLDELKTKSSELQSKIESFNVDLMAADENLINLKVKMHLKEDPGIGLKDLLKTRTGIETKLAELELDFESIQIAIREVETRIIEAKKQERIDRVTEARKQFDELVKEMQPHLTAVIGSTTRINSLMQIIYQNSGLLAHEYNAVLSFYKLDAALSLRLLAEMTPNLKVDEFYKKRKQHEVTLMASR